MPLSALRKAAERKCKMWNVGCKKWDVKYRMFNIECSTFAYLLKLICEVLPIVRRSMFEFSSHTPTHPHTHKPRFSFHILLSTILLCVTLQSMAQSTTDRFLWDQANTQITHASTPEEFLQAAETYKRLLDDDIVNPALLNNLGCALTMGGDYANAQRAFERAERYSGTTPETSEGVAAAISRRDQSERAELPWYDTAFFWHFRLPTRLRILTALAGWSLLWTGLLFYILRKRHTYKTLSMFLTLSETFLITGAMIFLLFGASSLFSIIQEKHAQSYWRNVKFSTMELSGMEEQ